MDDKRATTLITRTKGYDTGLVTRRATVTSNVTGSGQWRLVILGTLITFSHNGIPEHDVYCIVKDNSRTRPMPGRGGRRNGRIDEDSRVADPFSSALAKSFHRRPRQRTTSCFHRRCEGEHETIGPGGDGHASEEQGGSDGSFPSKSPVDSTVAPVHVVEPRSRYAVHSHPPIFQVARRHRRSKLLRGHLLTIFTEFELDSDDLDSDILTLSRTRTWNVTFETATPAESSRCVSSGCSTLLQHGEAWSSPWSRPCS